MKKYNILFLSLAFLSSVLIFSIGFPNHWQKNVVFHNNTNQPIDLLLTTTTFSNSTKLTCTSKIRFIIAANKKAKCSINFIDQPNPTFTCILHRSNITVNTPTLFKVTESDKPCDITQSFNVAKNDQPLIFNLCDLLSATTMSETSNNALENVTTIHSAPIEKRIT